MYNQSTNIFNDSYNSIKRRRGYEIEGFTNDILALRKQLRVLEKNILKYGSLEDKELILLNLGNLKLSKARITGEKANQISSDLQSIKTKVYQTENMVKSIPF